MRAVPAVTAALAATAALVSVAIADGRAANEARALRSLNDGWRYAPGPIDGAEAAGFDDTDWERITLPHTWNAADALRGEGEYRRGVGWYRRFLRVPRELEGKRLFLRFEGANQVADVYLDGEHAGRHAGGYTAFAFEVTELVSPGRESLLSVRVDNAHDPEIPPLEGDWTFYGGIYRDVWLVATEPVHVDLLDHASPGVFIDTPSASRERAEVRVRASVVNDGRRRREVELRHRILDAAGREAASIRRPLDLPAGGRARPEGTATLEEPELWSPARPYLYRVVTEILEGGRVVDRVENPLGVRTLELDAEAGFLLNGAPLRLDGTNRHQDRAGSGNALSDADHRRDLELIRRTGFNFLRLAHYPQDPVMLSEADRTGLLVWEEIPVVNRVTPTETFAENAERMLVEMIRQHYNHPSIAFWGTMNEVFLRRPDPAPEGYDGYVVALAERLDRRAREEDPGRITAAVLSLHEIEEDRGVADVPQVLGMNLYFGWYYGEFADLGRFLDEQRRRHPDRRLLVSEYGAGSDERVHAAEPRAFDFSPEYQGRFHAASYPQIASRPWLLGGAVWNQFDFGAAHRQDTRSGLNQKGLYTFAREPKDVAFYYEAMLTEKPVLRLAREWGRRAGSRPADRRQPVWVHSNLAEVELAVNGAPAGSRPVADGRATWTVELADGVNTLVARGRWEGREVADVARIVYEDRTCFFVGGMERGAEAPAGTGGSPAACAPEDRVAAQTAHAVNAGGQYSYVDGADFVWEADRPHGGTGPWGFVGGEPVRTHHRILETEEDALFQAAREGVRAYRFVVPDGLYELWIGMVELEHEDPGARVFSARVGDDTVFRDLDLARVHGRHVAAGRSVLVEASGGRGLTVQFEAERGRSTVSALRLSRR